MKNVLLLLIIAVIPALAGKLESQIDKKREQVQQTVLTDIKEWTLQERYEKAQELSSTISECHALVIRAYKAGEISPAKAAVTMDFMYANMAKFLGDIGESENAIQALDYSARFYKGTSLEAGRYVTRSWILRDNPESASLILEGYLADKEFMAGTFRKESRDADLMLSLATLYQTMERWEDAALMFETYLDWAESTIDEHPLLDSNVAGQAAITIYQQSQALGKGRYNQKRLDALARKFNKKRPVDTQQRRQTREENHRADDLIMAENFLRHIGELPEE